jgi:hypothetical protein
MALGFSGKSPCFHKNPLHTDRAEPTILKGSELILAGKRERYTGVLLIETALKFLVDDRLPLFINSLGIISPSTLPPVAKTTGL